MALYKKGEPVARICTSKADGGGRFWAGKHVHLFDSSPLYGVNPQWLYDSLKETNKSLYMTLGWHEAFYPYYGAGTNFPQGHPGIDACTDDLILYAPFDLEAEEKWLDPNGGNVVDTSHVFCKNANGKGGVFGFEHCRIIPKENKRSNKPMENAKIDFSKNGVNVKFTGPVWTFDKDGNKTGETPNNWWARIINLNNGWYIAIWSHGDTFYLKSDDVNGDWVWEV